MDRPKLEVADVFRRYGEAYRQKHGASMSTAQRRVMTAIEVCRTAALGGHLERCDQCGHERNAYQSAAAIDTAQNVNRLARAQWIKDRQAELLDCPYFHVVFTVPEEIAAIAYQNKEVVYSILFRATAETLRPSRPIPSIWVPRSVSSPCSTPGGQNLLHHPHLHCVVPGGGLSPDGRAGSPAGPDSSYRCGFCRACSAACFWSTFRRLSTRANCNSSPPWSIFAIAARSSVTWPSAKSSKWVVYAKRPFAGPEQVLDYVGRYTHRVAISNNRLLRHRKRSSTFQMEGLSKRRPVRKR